MTVYRLSLTTSKQIGGKIKNFLIGIDKDSSLLRCYVVSTGK